MQQALVAATGEGHGKPGDWHSGIGFKHKIEERLEHERRGPHRFASGRFAVTAGPLLYRNKLLRRDLQNVQILFTHIGKSRCLLAHFK